MRHRVRVDYTINNYRYYVITSLAKCELTGVGPSWTEEDITSSDMIQDLRRDSKNDKVVNYIRNVGR